MFNDFYLDVLVMLKGYSPVCKQNIYEISVQLGTMGKITLKGTEKVVKVPEKSTSRTESAQIHAVFRPIIKCIHEIIQNY